MDSEAASRGTTVYLVDKRIDMLPALLGTNLCSLRPHVERLAFSVIWVHSPHVLTIRGDLMSIVGYLGTLTGCRDCECSIYKVGDCFQGGLYIRRSTTSKRRSVSPMLITV